MTEAAEAAEAAEGDDADDADRADGRSPDSSPSVPVSNPVTGVSLHDVPGEAGVAEIRLDPGAGGPPEHVHRTTEERFAVREGSVTFRIDGRERRLGPGTEVRVSPGTPHTFRNEGDGEAAMTVRTVPSNDRLGAVVVTLFGLAHDGKVDDRGRPGVLRSMAMAEETLEETYFTGVPYGVQRALGRAFGPLARALGYRATEERYLDDAFWRRRAGEADAATGSDEREDDAREGGERGTDAREDGEPSSGRGVRISVVDELE
jgi:mannose-6-phosphate isomerase-like protein (cupin superfamily)